MISHLNFKKYFIELKRTREHLGLKKLLLRIFYYKYDQILIMKDLEEEQQFNFKNQIELRTIESKHLQEFEEFCHKNSRGGRNPGNIFREYQENNYKGFFAILDQKIIGYGWFGNHKMKHNRKDLFFRFLKDEIELKDGDVYGFDLFIEPNHRGEGNSLQFILKEYLLLKKLDYRRVFGIVDRANKSALWTYKLLHFKEYKRMIMRRLFLFFVFKNKKLFFDRAGHKWLIDRDQIKWFLENKIISS